MVSHRQEFEPSKYLASLIAAVNDGAKAAQAGALLFALVGIYLVATAFSASDEDLLRGKTVTITQIGASLPVSFSFAIAPFVFVFLHIYTLARYDMLGANVRQFITELGRTVTSKADRERCRQLLANVEFVQALVAPTESRLYSWVWRWLVLVIIAIFPITVLLLVQINALRYQSMLITGAQQFGLLIDLLAVFLFFYRNSLSTSGRKTETRLSHMWRWAGLMCLPAVMALDLQYLVVVPPDANPNLVRYQRRPPWVRGLGLPEKLQLYDTIILEYLNDALTQPLDLVVCPWLRWGCRYLRVDHRLLVDHVWDDKAIVELQSGGGRSEAGRARALASLEGLVLRDRSLRFAALDESALFAADLRGADLTNASLGNAALLKVTASGVQLARANLIEANLEGAQLQGADLGSIQLEGADLTGAQLQGANLGSGNLQGANLTNAQLQGADLSSAQLDGANLTRANLEGAQLFGAKLRYVDLHYAQLQTANIAGANLQATNLTAARLDAAVLSGAKLQGADLRSAQLQGSDLRDARLNQTTWGQVKTQGMTNLELSDLRDANYVEPPTPDEIKVLEYLLYSMPIGERRDEAIGLLDRLKAANGAAPQLRCTANPERQVLVRDPTNPTFKNIPRKWLITSPTPSYRSALVMLLEDLASGSSAMAVGVAGRVATALGSGNAEDRELYVAVACKLVANDGTPDVRLEAQQSRLLESECRRSHAAAAP
jgi:uncharacterized protein YjbI with pentapeptide repeats